MYAVIESSRRRIDVDVLPLKGKAWHFDVLAFRSPKGRSELGLGTESLFINFRLALRLLEDGVIELYSMNANLGLDLDALLEEGRHWRRGLDQARKDASVGPFFVIVRVRAWSSASRWSLSRLRLTRSSTENNSTTDTLRPPLKGSEAHVLLAGECRGSPVLTQLLRDVWPVTSTPGEST